MCVCVCVCVRVCARVRAYVRACVRAFVVRACARARFCVRACVCFCVCLFSVIAWFYSMYTYLSIVRFRTSICSRRCICSCIHLYGFRMLRWNSRACLLRIRLYLNSWWYEISHAIKRYGNDKAVLLVDIQPIYYPHEMM